MLFDYVNVYGNDIDSLSIKLQRINYALKYNVSDRSIIYSHITESDYLSCSTEKKYDFIIRQFPMGIQLYRKEKASLRKHFMSAVGSSIESFDVFVEQALLNLHQNGVLSFAP